MMDDELLEKLYGFCYARTSSNYEAQELCSDILFELVKAVNGEREIEHPYPFIWRVARNVYADFSNKSNRHAKLFYEGEAEELFLKMEAADEKTLDKGSTAEEGQIKERKREWLLKHIPESAYVLALAIDGPQMGGNHTTSKGENGELSGKLYYIEEL